MAFDPKTYFVGAAKIYYRAIGATGAWTDVGTTMDDTEVRIVSGWFTPDNLNGQLAPIRELDYLNTQHAEMTFTMAEIGGAKLALPVPNAVSTTRVTTATAAPAYTATTLAADAAIGATNIKVTSITGAAVGQYIRINTAGALAEYRQIDSVGTVGAGGTGLTFRDPLQKAHASGVAVTQTDGDGATIISPSNVRRQALTAYNDWVAVSQSPGGYNKFYLYNGFSMTETASITFGDETLAGIEVTVASRDAGDGAANWAVETI